MIISLNWLKKFTNIDLSVDDLSVLIGARLVEIESIVDLGEKYKGALVVKAVTVNKLEGSDHLSVVKINDGGIMSDIERDQDGNIQVVCGAPNIAAGQMVVWLTPGMIVPDTYGKADVFKLESRMLRGVMSHGMIASAKELDLFEDSDGILVLDDNVVAGTTFAEAYELDDYLIDIENKSLTHRPDCFGVIGFAREVAGILGQKFETPDYMNAFSADFKKASNENIEITALIEDNELSSRYLAIVMSGADGSKKSPLLIRTYLARVGVRPVSAVVDATNYIMLMTGQPLHAFDYDKVLSVSGGRSDIHVRAGGQDESLKLLDGREIKVTTNDIVIAAGDVAIALAGAMGGAETEIDNNTKRIIIESATFNLYNLRNTQMRFGIFSEAITRFTKGQPAELAMPTLIEAVKLISEWTGAAVISDLAEAYPSGKNEIQVVLDTDKINRMLGSDWVAEEIVDTLENVGFCISRHGSSQISLTVPYWRSDIHIIEDIAEEVGRIGGYDNITTTLPNRDFVAVRPSEFDDFRRKVRKLMTVAGANEVLTYSFVHGDIIKKAGLELDNSYKIINSISPDLQYYRQSLTPSLLGLINANIKQGYEQFALYEINKTHSKSNGLGDENVPVESDMMAMVFASKSETEGSPYYVAKKMFEYLAERIGVEVDYIPMDDDNDALFAPFEAKRSAKIIDKRTFGLIGVVGEYKKNVIKAFKASQFTAGFEIDLTTLFGVANGASKNYRPSSRYPSIERDICFQVEPSVTYAQIHSSISEELSHLDMISTISPVDIYKAEDFSRKNITIRINLVSHDKTLTGEDVNEIVNRVGDRAISDVGAAII